MVAAGPVAKAEVEARVAEAAEVAVVSSVGLQAPQDDREVAALADASFARTLCEASAAEAIIVGFPTTSNQQSPRKRVWWRAYQKLVTQWQHTTASEGKCVVTSREVIAGGALAAAILMATIRAV